VARIPFPSIQILLRLGIVDYKPWEVTCVAGDANIPLKTYNPFVDPSQQTQVMGTTVSVSKDMAKDLKAFTGVDLNIPNCD